MYSLEGYLALALLWTTGLLVGYAEWRRGFRIDIRSTFGAVYVLIYVLVPSVMLLWPSVLFVEETRWIPTFVELRSLSVAAAAMVFVFGATVYLTDRTLRSSRFDWIDEYAEGFAARVTAADEDDLFLVACLFLLAGLVSFYLYSLSVGGVIETLLSGQAIRSGRVRESVVEPIGVNLAFMKHFLRIEFLAAYLLFALDPDRLLYRRLRRPLLAASIVASLAFLAVYAGRMVAIVFVSVFLLYRPFGTRLDRVTVRNGAILAAIGLVIIAVMRPLLSTFAYSGNSLSNVTALSLLYEPILDISPPFVSLLVAIHHVSLLDAGWGFWFSRVFVDIVPGSLVGIESVQTVNKHNTELYGYQFQTEERTFIIASGMLAYYYYEFYALGMIVGGVLTGTVLRLLERLRNAIGRDTPYHILFVLIAMIIPNGMLNGDPANIIKNNIAIIGGITFVFLLQYFRGRT